MKKLLILLSSLLVIASSGGCRNGLSYLLSGLTIESVFDVYDCQGPAGPVGPIVPTELPGPQGPPFGNAFGHNKT